MKTIIAIAAGLATALAPVAGLADSYIDHTIDNKVLPFLCDRGYTLHDTVESALLDDGGRQTFIINPPAGAEVLLVAVGDWDSNDVDLVVRGAESGRIVASDLMSDDMPVCSFTSRGGSYRVTISVADTDAPSFVQLLYSSR